MFTLNVYSSQSNELSDKLAMTEVKTSTVLVHVHKVVINIIIIET